jgi:hypothetical protein
MTFVARNKAFVASPEHFGDVSVSCGVRQSRLFGLPPNAVYIVSRKGTSIRLMPFLSAVRVHSASASRAVRSSAPYTGSETPAFRAGEVVRRCAVFACPAAPTLPKYRRNQPRRTPSLPAGFKAEREAPKCVKLDSGPVWVLCIIDRIVAKTAGEGNSHRGMLPADGGAVRRLTTV